MGQVSLREHFMDFDQGAHLFRVVTLGEASVGKTSLINQLVNKTFSCDEPSTIGATFVVHDEVVEDFRLEMQIWDTAGQEKYKSLCPIYCRGSAGAVVVFDLTNRESFEKLAQWTTLVLEVAGTETAVFVAANKSDVPLQSQVTDQAIAAWSEAQGIPVVKTSAKTGDGVPQLFRSLAEAIYHKGCQTRDTPRLPKPRASAESESCC
jgi:small GTP-binding protein